MTSRCVRAALLTTIFAALPGVAVAQFPPPPGQPSVQQRWPDAPAAGQAAPAPQAQPQRPAAQPAPRAEPPADAAAAPAARPKPAAPAAPATVLACSGVFAKDSTHLKLAIKFDSRNITFGEVDGPDGSKLKASILYPNDAKRRLEVLWNNDATRSDTSVIAINGRSQWVAPKGLKIGLPLAGLEKANGRPFKLSGFGADGMASVTGWDGGALESLPGNCKIGVRLALDRKAPEDVRKAVAGEKELRSNDASLRAVKPAIAEILIGY